MKNDGINILHSIFWVDCCSFIVNVLLIIECLSSVSLLLFFPPFSSSSMLSPLYQDHGGSGLWPQTSSCSSSSQGLHRPLRCHPPPISGSSVGPNPTYYHTVYDVQVEHYSEVPFSGGGDSYGRLSSQDSMSLVTSNNDPTVPLIRRRGGLVDHRDVILAHQAHKLHNTPQARRKQWE